MENGKEGSNSRLPRWTRREMLALARAKQEVEGLAGAAASQVSARGRRPAVSSPDVGGGAVPKWSVVSEGCRARGVIRGPTQCRKRWTNLIAAFRKIKKWEEEKEEVRIEKGYWVMGSEERKEQGLPGRFDRVVYEFMDGKEVEEEGECERDAVVDSEEEEEGRSPVPPAAVPLQSVSASGEPIFVMPISMRRSPLFQEESPDPECGAEMPEKHQNGTPEEQTPSKNQAPKRKRPTEFSNDAQPESESTRLIKKLTETIERGTRLVAAQLEAQTIQMQMDRDSRKEQFEGVLKACNKLADGVMKIAERLEEKNSEKSNLTAC